MTTTRTKTQAFKAVKNSPLYLAANEALLQGNTAEFERLMLLLGSPRPTHSN